MDVNDSEEFQASVLPQVQVLEGKGDEDLTLTAEEVVTPRWKARFVRPDRPPYCSHLGLYAVTGYDYEHASRRLKLSSGPWRRASGQSGSTI